MADEAPAAAAPSAPPATPAAPPDGALPPPPAATEPTAKVPVTREDAIAQIEGSTDYAALEQELEAANKPKPEPVAEAPAAAPTPAPVAAAPEPEASTAPVAAAPAPAAEPGSEDETMEDPQGEKLPKNFRFHTDDPARSRYLKLLRQEPGANPIELALRAGYTLPATAAQPAAPVAATPAPTIDEVLKPMRDEIDALLAKKKEARDAFEFGTADEIADQILEKRIALDRKQSELEQEASFAEEYSSVYGEAKAEAVKRYPETAVKGSPQFEAVMRERAYLEQQEPGFFDDPNYPDALIDRLEKSRPDLFKPAAAPAPTPAPAPAPAVVTPPPNAAAKQPARPVGQVVAGTEGARPPLTKAETEKAIDEMSPEQLEALSDKVGFQASSKGRK